MLTPADKKSVLSEYNNYLKKKKATQDLCSPSAGCVFKNPAAGEKSAGELIDRCGLKGRRVGGAAVSEKHANFIVNVGGATAEDVIQLMDIMRSEVRARFAIELESEIRLV